MKAIRLQHVSCEINDHEDCPKDWTTREALGPVQEYVCTCACHGRKLDQTENLRKLAALLAGGK